MNQMTPAQRQMVKHRRVRKPLPSLRKHAMFNSFYARELKSANRRTYLLKRRIKDLEQERDHYVEQMVLANKRADGILILGHEEDTIKHEIRQLREQKENLEDEIVKLSAVVHRLKLNLREAFKRN